jgi:hypothetical protein
MVWPLVKMSNAMIMGIWKLALGFVTMFHYLGLVMGIFKRMINYGSTCTVIQ